MAMLYENNPKQSKKETIGSKLLERTRDYGLINPRGSLFDRKFNRLDTETTIDMLKNSVGQSKKQLSYPNGISPDGFGSSNYTSSIGMNASLLEPERAYQRDAENQVNLFWRKNRERNQKYYRIAQRAEIKEALTQIIDEAVYPNDLGDICTLEIDKDADIGDAVKEKLTRAFRKELLKGILKFQKEGWHMMYTLLVEGRLFLEVIFNEEKNKIVGVNILPSHNMIIILEEGVIVGYRQMLEGVFTNTSGNGGRNFIDYSPHQILYSDLGLYGAGGINDPRSPLEVAVKPFNQLNCIEDSIVMYRLQWGQEKLMFKIDTGSMPLAQAKKHVTDAMKSLSRRVDYNTSTGEVMNNGKVIGLSEHFFINVSQQNKSSDITRLGGGENLSNIDDLKYFKRNLVNSLMVPPGRITALAGDGESYSNGKLSEVTQAEVAFARMVQRYQMPWNEIMTRLFVMVLNTKNDIIDDIKQQDNFSVKFNKANNFQNYIEAEILNTNLTTFENMMKQVRTDENLTGPLAIKYALKIGLRMSENDEALNRQWLEEEDKKRNENK